jgi:hypothetical protein
MNPYFPPHPAHTSTSKMLMNYRSISMPVREKCATPPEMNWKSNLPKPGAFFEENRHFATAIFRHQKFSTKPETTLNAEPEISPLHPLTSSPVHLPLRVSVVKQHPQPRRNPPPLIRLNELIL